MEGSSYSSTSHIRSISLPSRLNPASTKIETVLNNLKKTREIFSLSTKSFQSSLVALAELYLSMEELVRSPHTQRVLLQHRNGVLVVEEALEKSLGLLDSCGNLRDLFVSMKEHVQELKSALRRKGGEDSKIIQSRIGAYFCSRKTAQKIIAKCIGSFKRMESKIGSGLVLDVDNYHLSAVIRVLREVPSMVISVLRSIWLFLSVKANPANGLSFISKLATKSIDQMIIGEVDMVDLALQSLRKNLRNNECKPVDVQVAMQRLQTVDASIEGFEAGLDCLFRRLIQHRSSLLNVLVS